jgi:hypothetical protein
MTAASVEQCEYDMTRGESFLVPAKAGAHARQAQLLQQVSMAVIDVDHLRKQGQQSVICFQNSK